MTTHWSYTLYSTFTKQDGNCGSVKLCFCPDKQWCHLMQSLNIFLRGCLYLGTVLFYKTTNLYVKAWTLSSGRASNVSVGSRSDHCAPNGDTLSRYLVVAPTLFCLKEQRFICAECSCGKIQIVSYLSMIVYILSAALTCACCCPCYPASFLRNF